MKLILILLVKCYFYHCCPRPTPILAADYIRPNISVRELDSIIIENIVHPVKGKGDDLVRNSFMYYDILDDVKNLFDEGNLKGRQLLDEIGREGPQWVGVEWDEHLLRSTYNWKRTDLIHFAATIDATVELWESFFENRTSVERA